MIFVTVGNSHYGFPRLIEKVDAIAPDLPLKVVAQMGWTRYRPRNLEGRAFLSFGEMMERMAEARLIIGHTSAGPILHARKFGVPLIAVPRRPELGEHVDGHQVETAKAVENLPMIEVLWDLERLRDSVLAILADPGRLARGRKPARGPRDLIAAIRGFVAAAESRV